MSEYLPPILDALREVLAGPVALEYEAAREALEAANEALDVAEKAMPETAALKAAYEEHARLVPIYKEAYKNLPEQAEVKAAKSRIFAAMDAIRSAGHEAGEEIWGGGY